MQAAKTSTIPSTAINVYLLLSQDDSEVTRFKGAPTWYCQTASHPFEFFGRQQVILGRPMVAVSRAHCTSGDQ